MIYFIKFLLHTTILFQVSSYPYIVHNFVFQKEVSRLRGFVNGRVENLDNDILASSFPPSPGPFKWEGGLHGSFSPLTSDKRMSQVCRNHAYNWGNTCSQVVDKLSFSLPITILYSRRKIMKLLLLGPSRGKGRKKPL